MKQIAEFVIIVMSMVGIIVGAIEFGQIGNLESVANLINVFSDVAWFVGSFIIATLFTAYLVVIANTKVILRFLAIPAWLVFSLSLLVTVDQFMGYSYPAVPPQATVIAYYVIKLPDNTRIIEAWMYLKDEGRARAYNFPYTEERMKALKIGQEGAQKGEPVEVDLRKGGGEDDGQKPESMIIYDWDLDAVHPGKEQLQEDAPTIIPDMSDDGNIYKRNSDGEIEVIDPAMKGQKKMTGTTFPTRRRH